MDYFSHLLFFLFTRDHEKCNIFFNYIYLHMYICVYMNVTIFFLSFIMVIYICIYLVNLFFVCYKRREKSALLENEVENHFNSRKLKGNLLMPIYIFIMIYTSEVYFCTVRCSLIRKKTKKHTRLTCNNSFRIVAKSYDLVLLNNEN